MFLYQILLKMDQKRAKHGLRGAKNRGFPPSPPLKKVFLQRKSGLFGGAPSLPFRKKSAKEFLKGSLGANFHDG